MPSELYHRAMKFYEAAQPERSDLQHRVWDPVPWMIDVYVGRGSRNDDRYRDILEWCHENWGGQTNPYSDPPGAGHWRAGHATVHGWNWFGFDTEQRMHEFRAVWGGTADEHDGGDQSVGLDNQRRRNDGTIYSHGPGWIEAHSEQQDPHLHARYPMGRP